MTYQLKEPTRSLLVPWAYMPASWGYRGLTEDEMDEWNKKAFRDLKMLVPDAVAVRPIIKGSKAVYAVNSKMLKEVTI
ncbi:MAG: hypothetical protein EOM21_19710 [Gammaproteobacteria bacterium]|nr:hypothetical protein [Gammaproteobacteria bacterium]